MAGDRTIAKMTVYCEDSSGTQEERELVARSFVNRLADPHKRYGLTIAEVCLRRCAYSEWNGDKLNNKNLMRAARCADMDPIMAACGAAVDSAQRPNFFDPTLGATHYHEKAMPEKPFWTAGATMTHETENFFFYNGVD